MSILNPFRDQKPKIRGVSGNLEHLKSYFMWLNIDQFILGRGNRMSTTRLDVLDTNSSSALLTDWGLMKQVD